MLILLAFPVTDLCQRFVSNNTYNAETELSTKTYNEVSNFSFFISISYYVHKHKRINKNPKKCDSFFLFVFFFIFAVFSFTHRELAELPYVKSCIALSTKQPKGSSPSPTKGAKKERM